MEKLKSCPFCGGDARIDSTTYWPDGQEQTTHYSIGCSTADCQGEACATHLDPETEAEAVKRWNNRPPNQGNTTEVCRCKYPYPDTINKFEGLVCAACGKPRR